jgi:tetratricopeptide (TPR) repeat protein
VDEIWIVDGTFHVCRLPLRDSDAHQRATFFEEMLAREGYDDPAMRAHLVMLWRGIADSDLEANENRRGHADGVAALAAQGIERILAHGAKADFLQARLALFRKDGETAARHLEESIAAHPTHREAVMLLAQQRLEQGRFDEAIDQADRAIALRPEYCDTANYVRAIALESLGRHDEAREAYLRHVKLRKGQSGVGVREAHALVERGFHASARLVYGELLDAEYTTGVAAELGVARAEEALGDLAAARRHYDRVLVRGPERRSTYATSPGIVAELTAIEAQARAALARLGARGQGEA